MKTLEAGTTKYLLLDAKRIERNAERGKLGEPIVIILEEIAPGAFREHRGVNLSVNGQVTLAYDQRGYVAKFNYDRHRAAYMTTAEVLLAEVHGEDLVITDGMVEMAADIDVSDADFVDTTAPATTAPIEKMDAAPTAPKKTTRKPSAK